MDILLYAHPEVVERKIEMRGEILEAYTEIAYRIEPQEKWDRFAAEWHAVGLSHEYLHDHARYIYRLHPMYLTIIVNSINRETLYVLAGNPMPKIQKLKLMDLPMEWVYV